MATAAEASPVRPASRWLVALGVVAALALAADLVAVDGRLIHLLVRLYQDPEFTRQALQRAGLFAPLIFIAIQALQVVISPIPGEVTGFLGGFLFGEALGFVYSTIGLTVGTLAAFGVGRWLGAPVVRRLVPEPTWGRLGFLVKAEGVIVCFVIYLIPGFPKDITCYLFGISPMPFWAFGVVSTLGRMPGTWILSAQGAKTASGQYLELALLTAVVVAAALPLYYFRHHILSALRRIGHGR